MSINGRSRSAMLGRVLAVVAVPALIAVTIALGIAVATDVPASSLLRDPAAVLEGPWYVGFFSTSGGVLWFISGAVSLLALSLDVPHRCRSLLRALAISSLILGADDLFLLHETIKNDLGIPSPVTVGFYGLVVLGSFYVARRQLLASPNVAVALGAMILLGTSLLLDFAGEAGLPTPPFSAIVEDVAKFVGIAVWAAFSVLESRRALSVRAATVSDLMTVSTTELVGGAASPWT